MSFFKVKGSGKDHSIFTMTKCGKLLRASLQVTVH